MPWVMSLGRADGHVLGGIEGVGPYLGDHIGEGTDLCSGHRQLQGEHDHLGELLAGHHVVGSEGAIREAGDDAVARQLDYRGRSRG